MTFQKFVGIGLAATIILGIIKGVSSYLATDVAIIRYGVWLVEVIVATACIRRLGTINYLESFMVMILWGIFMLVFDLIVLAVIFNVVIFSTLIYWVGMLLILLSWFLFHSKRHVEIRRQNKNK